MFSTKAQWDDLLDWQFWVFVLCLAFGGLVAAALKRARKNLLRVTGGVPGPRPSHLQLGNLGDVHAAGSLHEYVTQLHRDHGPVAGFWWMAQFTVSIGDPALWPAVRGLFDKPASQTHFAMLRPLLGSGSLEFANGDKGKERRRLYDPCLQHAALQDTFDALRITAGRHLDSWAGADPLALTE